MLEHVFIRRFLFLAGAVLSIAAIAELNSLDLKNVLAKIAAIVGLTLSGLVFVFLASCSTAELRRLVDRIRLSLTLNDHVAAEIVVPGNTRSVHACGSIKSDRIAGSCLVTLGLIWFVCFWIVSADGNATSADGDEGAYLEVATQIHDSGGTFTLVDNLFSGEFREANRHPLYLWLLSFRPSFEAGKALSLAISLVAFVAMLAAANTSRWFLHAGCLAVLLGSNSAFIRFAATVGCEPLTVLLMAMLWWVLFRWMIAPHDVSYPQTQMTCAAFVVGVLLALLWLSKGTGLVLAGAFGIWVLVRLPFTRLGTSEEADCPEKASVFERWTIRDRRWMNIRILGIVVVAWAMTASPLLIRNVHRHGQLFYNVNSWLLFADVYEDPVTLAERSPLKIAAVDYLRQHSLTDLARRECVGLIWESFILVRSLGPAPFDDSRVFFGGVLSIFILIGFWQSTEHERSLLAILVASSLAVFAWYVPVAAGERFIFPLLGPLAVTGTQGLIHTAMVISQRTGISSVNVVVTFCLIWLLIPAIF